MSETSTARTAAPYPASWIDHLTDWIGRLPGPGWVFYVLATAVLILLGHGLRWLEGTIPIGVFIPARVAEAPFTLYLLGLMHYLNGTARTSMDRFRPALAMDEIEVARLRYQFTTLPRSVGIMATAIGVPLGLLSVVPDPMSWGITAGSSPATYVYVAVISVGSMIFALAFLIHTVRQLRLVNRIHRMATQIHLLERTPVYAFSALTARTGIGIVLLIYYYIFTYYILHFFGPAYKPSLLDGGLAVFFVLLAGACFILPLSGMHHRLTEEKSHMVDEADRRFEATLQRLHRRLDAESLEEMDGLNKALASLVIERDALAKISTWPWRPETLRGFLTSIALPVIVWLVTAILGKLLEA